MAGAVTDVLTSFVPRGGGLRLRGRRRGDGGRRRHDRHARRSAPGGSGRRRRSCSRAPASPASHARAARSRSAPRPRSRRSSTCPRRSAPAPRTSATSRSARRRRWAATSARARVSARPRGDLQGALLAVGAQVRSAGAGGETTEPLEDFLANRRDRLVLDVSYDEPAAGAFVALDRPHTHEYTVLAVSAARLADGTVRLAATGAGSCGGPAPVRGGGGGRPPGRRSRGAPGRDPARRRARVGVVPLAGPARARPPGAHPAPGERMKLPEGMRLIRERAGARDRERPAHAASRGPARGADDHEPEGRLPAGRLRRVHRPRRRQARPLLPAPRRRRRRLGGDDARRHRHAGAARACPGRVLRAVRLAVRVLHPRSPDGHARAARADAQAVARRDRGGARRPRLPLHRLREDPRLRRGGRQREQRREGRRRQAPALRRRRRTSRGGRPSSTTSAS